MAWFFWSVHSPFGAEGIQLLQSLGKYHVSFCQGQITEAKIFFLKTTLRGWLRNENSSSDCNFLHGIHHPLQKYMHSEPLGIRWSEGTVGSWKCLWSSTFFQ